jgi:hypothetical protein
MLIYKCVQTFFALAVVIIYATSNVFAQQDICKAISCLDMGLTPCDRSTETCSPCIYLINGDSYSCYQKENDQCPFPDTIAICGKLSLSYCGRLFPYLLMI